ncbi:aa3-type cytochrome oxidase subunit CtaJ [Jatrophihabitans sp. YIM 134969]
MTWVETVLVFAGIPLAVLLVVATVVLAPSAVNGTSRYRPGRPWGHAPAWWLPDPDAVGELPAGVVAERASRTRAIAATAAEEADRSGLSAEQASAAGAAAAERRASAAVGGASGEW